METVSRGAPRPRCLLEEGPRHRDCAMRGEGKGVRGEGEGGRGDAWSGERRGMKRRGGWNGRGKRGMC